MTSLPDPCRTTLTAGARHGNTLSFAFGHTLQPPHGQHLQHIHPIFNATMVDLLMKTGHSPHLWWEGLNVMLEKIPGNFNVEKLWIILLFEEDFNAKDVLS